MACCCPNELARLRILDRGIERFDIPADIATGQTVRPENRKHQVGKILTNAFPTLHNRREGGVHVGRTRCVGEVLVNPLIESPNGIDQGVTRTENTLNAQGEQNRANWNVSRGGPKVIEILLPPGNLPCLGNAHLQTGLGKYRNPGPNP